MKKLNTAKENKTTICQFTQPRRKKSSSASSEYYPVFTMTASIRGVDLYQHAA
jgi:hypothetical protein